MNSLIIQLDLKGLSDFAIKLQWTEYRKPLQWCDFENTDVHGTNSHEQSVLLCFREKKYA